MRGLQVRGLLGCCWTRSPSLGCHPRLQRSPLCHQVHSGVQELQLDQGQTPSQPQDFPAQQQESWLQGHFRGVEQPECLQALRIQKRLQTYHPLCLSWNFTSCRSESSNK